MLKTYNDRLFLLEVKRCLLVEKNKQIANKRSGEEIKKALKQFGSLRASYKADMQKKNDLKEVFKYYDYYLANPAEPQYFSRERDNATILNHAEMSIAHDSKTIEVKRILSSINKKCKIKHRKRRFITERENGEKVCLTKVKNFTKNIMDEPSVQQRVFTINFKIDGLNTKNKMFKERLFENENKIPSDFMVKKRVVDKIFDQRCKSKSMLNLHYIDKEKRDNIEEFDPLSIGDMRNYPVFGFESLKNIGYKKEIKLNHFGRSTSLDFAKQNFNKYRDTDLLHLRQTMGNFKVKDLSNLTKTFHNKNIKLVFGNPKVNKEETKQKKKKAKGLENMYDSALESIFDIKRNKVNQTINKNALDSAFLTPNFTLRYGKHFLPRSGSGLLFYPNIEETKKKTKIAE